MEEIHIPSYFLCPISLEIFRDPVTLSTGITYDRESIEKWLYTSKNTFCPVTKQELVDMEITPNHTLRRLIQSWCTLNSSYGIERIPTPKLPVDRVEIFNLISNAKIPELQMISLRRLESIAAERDANKKCIESTSGAVEFLASLVIENSSTVESDGLESAKASEEALSILYNLKMSEASLRTLASKNEKFLETLVGVLGNGNCQARAYSVLLLKSLLEHVDPIHVISLSANVFVQAVSILRDQISQQARKAALQILIDICPWGRNRVKAVDAGAVQVLVELLLDKGERRDTERMLVLLDQLCGCAEGRADLIKHGAGIAVVSKKAIRVSQLATERAVRILHSVSRFTASPSVIYEMLQVGVVSKLCLILQVEPSLKTKEKAREILGLHSRAWKSSPCIPSFLLSSYPL